MKYCGKCGASNGDEMSYCNVCGNVLQSGTEISAAKMESKPPVYETKIIQVDNSPSVINASNEVWGYFGWSVQNVQVTHSQDTRTYTKDFADYYTGSKTVETTTINYATITYQRNKNMPNYKEIVALEAEYDRICGEESLVEMDCEVQPMNYTLLVILFLCGIWPGVLYYLYCDKKKKDAENKLVSYSNSERGQSLHNRKLQIVEEATAMLG